jgi:hypothetical protein
MPPAAAPSSPVRSPVSGMTTRSKNKLISLISDDATEPRRPRGVFSPGLTDETMLHNPEFSNPRSRGDW